jgi:predicted anti-sigma-YlaC factor YlaD
MENEGLVMHCSKAARQLQLYTDKQLNLEQTRTLESHLSTCPACCKDYYLLAEIDHVLNTMGMIQEPADLTVNVMRRVALSVQRTERQIAEPQSILVFRPSFSEILIASLLATVAMCGLLFDQQSIRTALFGSNSHDPISILVAPIWNAVQMANSDTLMICLWISGTVLGIWITLLVAGSDMRNEWFRAVLDRLPVW